MFHLKGIFSRPCLRDLLGIKALSEMNQAQRAHGFTSQEKSGHRSRSQTGGCLGLWKLVFCGTKVSFGRDVQRVDAGDSVLGVRMCLIHIIIHLKMGEAVQIWGRS